MASRERAKYNFPIQSKNRIRLKSRGKDVLENTIDGTEQIHHLVACWYAIQENIPRKYITHSENGVVLNKKNHDQLHNEMKDWSPEQEFVYFTAVLEHIHECLKGGVSKTLREVKPPLYEIGEAESIIYEAVGD